MTFYNWFHSKYEITNDKSNVVRWKNIASRYRLTCNPAIKQTKAKIHIMEQMKLLGVSFKKDNGLTCSVFINVKEL